MQQVIPHLAGSPFPGFAESLAALQCHDSPVAQGAFWHVQLSASGVVTATIACPGEGVNTLRAAALEELGLIVDRAAEAAATRSWRGLIITTGGDAAGGAGANVHEIAALAATGDENAIIAACQQAKAVLARLNALPLPVVALMNGEKWLGGFFELSLWCHWRLAVSGLSVGLPEIKLSIFPGFGATQLLPRLMPRLTDAIELVTGLKNLTAEEALAKGLIDQIIDAGQSADCARAFCLESPYRRRLKRRRRRLITHLRRALATLSDLRALAGPGRQKVLTERLLPGLLERAGSSGRFWLLQSINQEIRKRTILSAPLTAARLLMQSRDWTLSEGLDEESRAFAEEALSPFGRGSLGLFTQKGGARSAFCHVPTLPVSRLAIVGAGGPMGSGIAALYAAASQIEKLVLVDISPEALEEARARVHSHLVTAVGEESADEAMQKIVFSVDLQAVVGCQAIIEAVTENLELKQKIFSQIRSLLFNRGSGEAKVFLFSNTSALDLNELTADLEALGDLFAGLHFFNPPEAMHVVEIARAESTTDETMAVAVQLATIAGKAPIPCRNRRGFVVNRILGAYLVVTDWLLSMGVPPHAIDQAMKATGVPMGPLELLDLVGVDVATSVAKTLSKAFGSRFCLPPADCDVLSVLLKARELGKKTGIGAYVWKNDGRAARDKRGQPQINPRLSKLIPGFAGNQSFSREAIQYLLLGAVINEALRAVEDGVVAPEHLQWIDVAFSLGTGIDAVYGGPLQHLDAWGVRTFEQLSRTIHRCGSEGWRELFAPCDLLQQLASTGESFASYCKRQRDTVPAPQST